MYSVANNGMILHPYRADNACSGFYTVSINPMKKDRKVASMFITLLKKILSVLIFIS